MKQLILLLFFIPTIIFSQNKLDKAKEELKEKNRSSNGQRREGNRGSSSNNSSLITDLGLDYFFMEMFFRATVGVAIGDANERDLNPYPYYYSDEGEYAKELSDTGRKQSLKLGMNYVFNNINGFELSGLYKPLPIIGIKASHLHFSEKNRTDSSSLDVSSFLINYHRVREKNITIWWGAGAAYVSNGVNDFGFTYNLGTEIYPFKPISMHLSWQESFVNESKINVFKSQLKYHLKNKTVFVGYHAYQVGGQSIKGPAIGFEITF